MKQLILEVMGLLLISGQTLADQPTVSRPLVGYTELQTNLPGGRHVVRCKPVVTLRTSDSINEY